MEVVLRDRSKYSCQVDYPKGSIQNPLTRDEMRDKFRSLTSAFLDDRKQQEVERVVFEMEKLKDISALIRLVAQKGR